jgi:hypothetical protein
MCAGVHGEPGAGDADGVHGCGELAAHLAGVRLAAVAAGEHRPGVAALEVPQMRRASVAKAGG